MIALNNQSLDITGTVIRTLNIFKHRSEETLSPVLCLNIKRNL